MIGDVERMSVTYRPILTVGNLAHFQHVLMYVGNDGVSIHSELGLKREKLAAVKQRHT